MPAVSEEISDAQLLEAGERALDEIDASSADAGNVEIGTRRLNIVNICHSSEGRSKKLSDHQRAELRKLLGV